MSFLVLSESPPRVPNAVGEPLHRPAASKASLATLPPKLQSHILDHIGDEDTLARLGATGHDWQSRITPRVFPPRPSDLSLLLEGRRHALARAWALPPDADPSRTMWGTDAERIAHWHVNDGMTRLMHAATTGDGALLRCLLRYVGNDIDQVDACGLTAMHWAHLTGHHDTWAQAIKLTPGTKKLGPVFVGQPNLHDAMAVGHRYLTATLLRGFYGPVAQATQPKFRSGYSLTEPLSCGATPYYCARHHGAPDRGLPELVLNYTDAEALRPPSMPALTAGATFSAHAWAADLRNLVARGFDLHAPPTWGVPYLQRWLECVQLTPASVAALHTICCGGVMADTPTGRAVWQAALGPRGNRDVALTFLRAGLIFADDVHAAAQAVISRFGMDAPIWTVLSTLGVDLYAVDLAGRTLAHFVVEHADYQTRHRGLFFLAAAGLDVQQRCDAGINPVIEAVLKDRTGEFAELAGTCIAFDQPGVVCRDLLKPFYAHTALEATLAVGDGNGAEYLLLADRACSAQQMAQAYARVDAFFGGCWALKRWFKRRLWARRLGLRGMYIDLNNPAGGWHAQLSRKRTQRALAEHRAVLLAEDASRRQRFGHTVRGSALAGAVTARRIASPVTWATDVLLGTQRDEENSDRPTSPMARCLNGGGVGGVFGASLVIVGGVAAYPVAAAVAPGLSFISARSLLWVEEKRFAAWYYGFDQPVLRPLAQTVATLGCVPKALASGVGLGAGAIFGVAKGTARYLAQRPA